ncbi:MULTISPECIES: dihydroxy-acid dehydratase [Streptacidiphilus]|uniref:Dihydroxy-acid dehydratase n=1 Tax=Streptacidiphilus cavernicola TaxID=3342716 RepID=A0ABV6UVN7_9ACTN|nr:dihydroxy-acid dehydratase [Streptacidiphilus jeojiense]
MTQDQVIQDQTDSSRLDGDAGFAARSFLRSGGLTSDQVRRRPVIGIATSWSELNPCNLPTRPMAEAVKRGVAAAGGIALEFPTISLAESLIHPTTMLLRNLMAMDVEEMISASPIDAVVLLGGCDKTVAAQLMGALSADKPALSLTTGPRPAGRWRGGELTIDDSWRIADERRSGLLDDRAWHEVEGCISPGPGVCNVMGTAVTLAMIAEILGFAPPGSSLLPAGSPQRLASAEQAGARAVELARDPVLPSRLVTREALTDAWRLVCATGGSTNAVIHLQALAGRAGVRLSTRHLREASRTTPTLGQVRPNGPHTLADLHDEGGVPAVVRELGPLLHLDRPTADGSNWREVAAGTAPGPGRALRPAADPVHPHGAIAVLHGSLAPRSAVIKRSAASPRLLRHTGPALVFDGLADLRARIDDPDLPVTADTVLVLRGAGPIGGPGMAEVGGLPIPAKLYRAGVRDMVRVSDARMSGTAAGTVVLHVTPEAAVGGPLALVRDGDPIRLDVPAGTLDLLVDPDTLDRRARDTPPATAPRPARGYRRLYADHVGQADEGCDFDFLHATPEETP